MKGKRIVFVLFLLFCVVYYIARVSIFTWSSSLGTDAFEHEVSELSVAIVSYSFLMIGVLGFIFLAGIVLHKPWGFWGTIAVSAYTVAWDIWAAIWVQSSAAIGIAPAIIIMGYLLLYRKDFLGPTKPTVPQTPAAG